MLHQGSHFFGLTKFHDISRFFKVNFQVFFHYFYRPQRSWGKVIFSEACVKNSVHEGGGACMAGGGMRGREACMPHTSPRHHEIRLVNARVVLVLKFLLKYNFQVVLNINN